MDSIDRRMESFVSWYGEVPPDARRIEDFEARKDAASWVRRNIGVGIVHGYVIGYKLYNRWWTVFFERIESPAPEGAEKWHLEGYSHTGLGWTSDYYFWPDLIRWRHELYQRGGDDYGRYPVSGKI